MLYNVLVINYIGGSIMDYKRASNFELMRIISMIFIVIGHTLSWGGITSRTTGITTLIIYFIYAMIVVHVNSFILLTGYYQYKLKFKISKIINLLMLMFSYRVVLYTLSIILGWQQYKGIYSYIFNVLPISNFSYWFLNIYIILYLLSPFLNKLISSINRNEYRVLLLILFITCSIIPRVTLNSFFDNSDGYSLIQFIFMYLIGAYLNKYGIERSINIFGKNIIIPNKAIKFLILYLLIGTIKYLLNYIGYRLCIYNSSFLNIIGKYLSYSFDKLIYDDPLIIIQSISYFMFFAKINIKSRIIYFFAKSTNEIYLFHMNVNIRSNLYLFFGLSLNQYTYKSLPMAILIALSICLIGSLIYYFRKLILHTLNYKTKIINR